MLDGFTAASFDPHRNSIFRVAVGDDEVELRLAAVDRLPAHPVAPRREPFSLIFSGPREMPLGQRIHRLRHVVLGDLEIFLVPIGPGPEGAARYEAVFN